MNILWAPKSSNKNVVQFQKYNVEKFKINGKNVWKTKKMKNKLNFLDTKKVQKVQIFWVTKKQKWNFLEKKVQKVQRVFLKKQKWNFFFELLELFDFFDF